MNILLAIKEENIKKEIKKISEINVVHKNIEYKEGILEFLEKNKKINYIIFSESLPGQIIIFDLIKKIKNMNKKIKIIILAENNYEELSRYADIVNIKNFKIKYLLNKMNINYNQKEKNDKNNEDKLNKQLKEKNIFIFEANLLELNRIKNEINKINNLIMIIKEENTFNIDPKIIENIFPKLKIKKFKELNKLIK